MEPIVTFGLAFLVMVVLIFLGVPIAFSLFAGAVFGLYFIGGSNTVNGFFTIAPYTVMASYPIAVAPLFMLLGEIAGEIGLSQRAFEVFHKWFGSLPGGVLVATIGGGALFGFCCGSTAASAALFSKIVIPETRRLGYDDELSLGTVSASGTLATIIPPSVMMVFYGILTGTSIGKVMLAGIIPGIIIAALFALYIFIYARLRPLAAPAVKIQATNREKLAALVAIWPIAMIFITVVGGIYLGIATPTEVGALSAAIIIIYALATGTKWQKLTNAFNSVVKMVGQIFLIIVAGMMLSRVVALSGASQTLLNYMVASNLGFAPIIILIIAIFLVLGCLLDPTSMLILTLPIVFPIVSGLGFDPVAFGIIVIILVEEAVITPPIGMNCFIVAASVKVDPMKVFKGVVPFFFILLAGIALVVVFPQIALWLPGLAGL